MSTPDRAGWYDDPEDDSQLRYFDGIIWSDRTVPRQAPTRQPAASSDSGAPQGGPGTDVFGRPVGGGPQQGQAGLGQYSPQGHPGPGQQQGWGQQPSWGHGQTPAGGYPQPAEPTTADGQPLAGYGARVGAYLLDALIVGVLNLLISGWAWYFWMADYWSFAWDAAVRGDQDAASNLTPEELLGFFDWRFFFVALALSLLVQVGYHVGFLAARGATPGKMIVGISVRRMDRPGPLGGGPAFMRYLLPLSISLLSLLPLLGYVLWIVSVADLVWPALDPQRQALHDKIAGTQVVRGKQLREASAEAPAHQIR